MPAQDKVPCDETANEDEAADDYSDDYGKRDGVAGKAVTVRP